jgi:anti-sigma factor RsiW
MNCPSANHNPELLVALAAGELTLDCVQELESHLAVCPACRSAATEQAAVWRSLDAWDAPPVSVDFNRRLYSRIEQGAGLSWFQRLAHAFRSMPLRQALPLSATAGLLLMAGLIAYNPIHPAPAAPNGNIVRANQVERTLDDIELLRQFNSAGSAESAHPDAM